MRKLVALMIGFTLAWSGGSLWVLIYIGEPAGILCIFAPFIAGGIAGVGYLVYVAFFMGKGG